ncbi:MAG: hypothetical protein U0168_26200 [Nannocystaceae bacterium]
MAPLLRQLQATVRPRRLRLAAIAAATAGGLALLASLRARGPDCDGAAALGEAWTPARRDAIAERVQQLGLPYGRESLAVIEQDLDAWAGQWRSHYDVRCRGSSPDRDAVLSCLAELRAGLAATVDALERVDAARLPHAIGSVDALPRPASCERVLWRLAQDAAASGCGRPRPRSPRSTRLASTTRRSPPRARCGPARAHPSSTTIRRCRPWRSGCWATRSSARVTTRARRRC